MHIHTFVVVFSFVLFFDLVSACTPSNFTLEPKTWEIFFKLTIIYIYICMDYSYVTTYIQQRYHTTPPHSFSSVVAVYDLPPELWDRELAQQAPAAPHTDHWLQQWLSSLPVSCSYTVPLTASIIHTPLCAAAWHLALRSHPDQCLVEFMLNGICNGFRIGFTKLPSSLKAARSNLEGAREYPDIVTDYLNIEISLGRVAGPFPPKAVPQVHISHFGVIPKGQTGRWRLIVDLSHPRGYSVNDGIPKSLCSLKYVTIDEAIKGIIQLGRGTLLAKIDIKSAFRLLPVHPADRHMLGMQWNGGIYIDTCLPLGLRSASKLFDILAEFLAWVAKQSNVSFLIHYLDDFLTMGPTSSLTCQHNLDTIIQMCNYVLRHPTCPGES